MMEIKSEIGFDPFLEFLFGAEESSEDTEEAQEELDSGCDYALDESICLDPDSDGSGSDGETSAEFTVTSVGKSYPAPKVPLEIYARNTEELHSLPNKGCHNAVNRAGKKVAATSKKAKKAFSQIKNRLRHALPRR